MKARTIGCLLELIIIGAGILITKFVGDLWGLGIFLIVVGVMGIIITVFWNKITYWIPIMIIKKSNWLLGIVASNQKNIYKAVNGHIARWDFSGLKIAEAPYFQLHFQLFNTSIFALDFESVEGIIIVGGIKCHPTPPTANSPQRAIAQGQEFWVIVTQAVLPEMARKILEAGNNGEKLNFNLNQLTLNIVTSTKGYEGLKPRVYFDATCTPDIAAWLRLQTSQKIGYWG